MYLKEVANKMRPEFKFFPGDEDLACDYLCKRLLLKKLRRHFNGNWTENYWSMAAPGRSPFSWKWPLTQVGTFYIFPVRWYFILIFICMSTGYFVKDCLRDNTTRKLTIEFWDCILRGRHCWEDHKKQEKIFYNLKNEEEKKVA